MYTAAPHLVTLTEKSFYRDVLLFVIHITDGTHYSPSTQLKTSFTFSKALLIVGHRKFKIV